MKDRVFFPNLDGLRFFCFLSVFLYHGFYTSDPALLQNEAYSFIKHFLFANGNLGVNFFFVLSGFLITYLLLSEREQCGRIDVPRFYLRRVLRIWPLFYACVLIGFVLFPYIKKLSGLEPAETANWWMYLTFLNNFDVIREGLPDASILGVLWSIAVEEQFYLVWPLLLALFPPRFYGWLFAVIGAVSVAFRAFYAGNEMVIEYHTLSVISDMAIGGAAAWLAWSRNSVIERVRVLPKIFIVLIYVLVLLTYLWRDKIFAGAAGIAIERVLSGVLFALVILEQNYAQRSLFKFSSFPRISRLGTITYGMYCLHFLAILIALRLTGRFYERTELWQVIADTLLALVLTIVISLISYRFFERPFLQLKKRFQRIASGDSTDRSSSP